MWKFDIFLGIANVIAAILTKDFSYGYMSTGYTFLAIYGNKRDPEG